MVMKPKGISNSSKPVDYSKQLEAIKKQGNNKSCFDCGEKGTTYVVLNFGTFVCSRCSGILRELNFKVKGTGVSIFSEKDIELINNNGNDKAKELWLGKFNINRDRLPDPRKYEDVKQHIIEKYKNKKYYSSVEGKASKKESESENESDDNNDDKKKKEAKSAKIKKPKTNKDEGLNEINSAKSVPLINFSVKENTNTQMNNTASVSKDGGVNQNDFQFPNEEKSRQSDQNDWGSIWGNSTQFEQQQPQTINQGNVANNNQFDIPITIPNQNNAKIDSKQPQLQQIPNQSNNNPFVANEFPNANNQPQRQMPQKQQQVINPNQTSQVVNSGANQNDFSSLEKALFNSNAPNQQQPQMMPNQIGANSMMNANNNMQAMLNNPQMMMQMQMMMQNPQIMQMMMSMMNGQNQMGNPNMNIPNMNMPNNSQNQQMNKAPMDYNKIFQDNTPSMTETQSAMPKKEEKEDAFKDIYNFSQKALNKTNLNQNQAKQPIINQPNQAQINTGNQIPFSNNNMSSVNLNPKTSNQIPNNNISNNPFEFHEPITTSTQSMPTQPSLDQQQQPKALSPFQDPPQTQTQTHNQSQPQPLISPIQLQHQQQNINQMGDYNPFNFL